MYSCLFSLTSYCFLQSRMLRLICHRIWALTASSLFILPGCGPFREEMGGSQWLFSYFLLSLFVCIHFLLYSVTPHPPFLQTDALSLCCYLCFFFHVPSLAFSVSCFPPSLKSASGYPGIKFLPDLRWSFFCLTSIGSLPHTHTHGCFFNYEHSVSQRTNLVYFCLWMSH